MKQTRQNKNPRELQEIQELLACLPDFIQKACKKFDITSLIDIVMDLGRTPEIRTVTQSVYLQNYIVSQENINSVISKLGNISSDNRAGIEKTLHRISVIKNCDNKIIGLTARIGRNTQGSLDYVKDILENIGSLLIIGVPGSGKTSKLRELARFYSEDLKKRVIIVDSSLEIGGGGDIPHYSIGKARRMPVREPFLQHKIMLEAVENHTPEIIIIDEISTREEALAAQTIAERGVSLIATAHGKDLASIIKNPALSLLVGDPQSVTLSDEEAKRRKTQKNIIERTRPATFDSIFE